MRTAVMSGEIWPVNGKKALTCLCAEAKWSAMLDQTSPKVTFIIPTLNAGRILGNCLRSIRRQDYPQEQIEIIVADGGSSDDTCAVAQSFNAFVVKNPERVAESGKRVALGVAQGEYVVFTDADNEVSSNDFVGLAVGALVQHPGVLGVESYYPAAPGMNSFCAYLTETLHISDPVTWMMCVNPVLRESINDVERWSFPGKSLAFPLGANGFVYRKKDLEGVAATEHFEDTQIALRLAMSGKREWLRLSRRGVHHYVVGGIWDFVKKRRRQTYHFLSQKKSGRGDLTWTRMEPRMSGWMACLLCATVLVPLAQTVRGLWRTGDTRWFWHPVASLLSVAGVAWGAATFIFSKKTADDEARLQPIQRAQ